MTSADSSMLELFRQELETQTELLNEGLLLIERQPGAVTDLDGLMRAAHSIKGAARIVGLGAASRLAHALEDCFVAAGRGDLEIKASQCDDLLAAVDLLQSFGEVTPATEQAWVADRGTEVDGLIERLDALARPGLSHSSGSRHPGVGPDIQPTGPSSLDPMWDVFRSAAREPVSVFSEPGPPFVSHDTSPTAIQAIARACERLAGLARIAGLTPVERVANIANGLALALRGSAELEPARVEALADALDALGRFVTLDRSAAVEQAQQCADRLARWEGLEVDAAPAIDTIPTNEQPTPMPPSAHLPDGDSVVALVSEDDIGELSPTAQSAGLAQPAVGPVPAEKPDRFVRISSENLDQLMGLSAETLVQVNWLQKYADSLVELKRGQDALGRHLERLRELDVDMGDRARATLSDGLSELSGARQMMNARLSEIEEYARQSLGLSDRLYREVLESRMRPLEDGLRGFKRSVRDLARGLGKTVHLEFEGEDTQVDRDVLERLESPFDHLLRNAVDHGIEPSAQRVARGKPIAGRITLRAAHRGGMLSIQLEDDGGGIDVEKIRRRLVEHELATEEASQGLSDEELLDFLFMAGFSTASEVTELSGRGVGLDLVRASIGAAGGSIHAVTRPGEGTCFQLELPLTLSVVRTLLVRISGQTYAVPLTRVEQVLRIPRHETFTIQHRLCCSWNGHNVGLVPADRVLELPPGADTSENLNVVCVTDRSARYGICVDQVLGEQDLVVRPIDQRLGKVPDVSAAATTSDGSLVIILDVDDMTRSIARLKAGGQLTEQLYERKPLPLLRRRVLVADDSAPVRELEARKLEQAGYEVVMAADGEEAWAQLAASRFDLVVSDVDMPNLNGFELATRVKSAPTLADLPIMLVSYNDTDEYRHKGLASGANRYVTKREITTGQWLEAVRDLIGESDA